MHPNTTNQPTNPPIVFFQSHFFLIFLTLLQKNSVICESEKEGREALLDNATAFFSPIFPFPFLFLLTPSLLGPSDRQMSETLLYDVRLPRSILLSATHPKS